MEEESRFSITDRREPVLDAVRPKNSVSPRFVMKIGGLKVKTETMWKETLESVNYTAWTGDEVDVRVTEATIDEEDSIKEKFDESKFDGLTIDNLKENASELDIMEMLQKVCDEEELTNMSIHPTGSTKSKLVKIPDPKTITFICSKLDKKIVDGRMIHSRPHVPVTPPKTTPETIPPPNPLASTSMKTPSKSSLPSTNIQSPSSQPIIPGLPEDELIKAAKKEKNKQKKEKASKKKKKDESGKKTEKTKSEEMKKEDFLIQSDDSIIDEFPLKPRNLDGFQFSDYSDSEADVFEDSKEELNLAETELDELFTPLSWKSKSAANIALSLVNENSLPRPRTKSEAIK